LSGETDYLCFIFNKRPSTSKGGTYIVLLHIIYTVRAVVYTIGKCSATFFIGTLGSVHVLCLSSSV
jgi:hypothetical protein